MRRHYTTIRSEDDILIAVHYTKSLMRQLSFTEMEKQKVIVGVSELTRNILDHADSNGYFCCEIVDEAGIRLTVKDHGKGIEQVEKILNGEKHTRSRGLGIGLSGTKRLMDEFSIDTSREGTEIVAIKWRGSSIDRTYKS